MRACAARVQGTPQKRPPDRTPGKGGSRPCQWARHLGEGVGEHKCISGSLCAHHCGELSFDLGGWIFCHDKSVCGAGLL